MGWSQKSGWTYSNNVYSSYFIASLKITKEESMSCITSNTTPDSNIFKSNKSFNQIQYNFFSKSIAFKKEKNYQFNTIVVNYLQNKTTEYLFSPPLYMITPFGRETGVFSNNLYDGYKGSTGSSDTAFLPHPYFKNEDDYKKLNKINQGRIFKLHYYSTPYDNITSYKTKNPIIYSSNNLFGKSSNLKKNDGEGIVSFDINEINWFIQGYSYVSLHNITQKISYWKDSNNNLTGGILFGKGWYSFPNNMYVWFDGYFDYDDLVYDKNWQFVGGNTWMFGLLRDNEENNYDMRNQPVGGPWVGNPNVHFPGVGDYYNIVNVPPQAEPNKGSILNGTVKSPHKGFRENNYISKFINMDRYNFSINYHNTRNDNTGIRIYTSTKLPSSNPIQYKKYIFNTTNTPIVTDPILLDKSVIGLKLELDIKCKSIGDLIINFYSHSKPNTIINIFNGDGREVDDLNATFTFDLNQEKISIILDSDWKNINNKVFSIQGDIGVGSKLLQSNTRDFRDFYSNSADYFKLKFEHGLGYTPTINKANLILIYDDFILNEPIVHLTQSVDPKTYNFYGLEGNKHLVIVADKIESTSFTHSIVTLKDLNISQSYHNLNNSLISIDKNFAPIGLSGTTYSHKSTIGSGNDFNLNNSTIDIHTMVGTGRFTSGIWENGNWINGWRDSEIYEFFNVNNFYSYNRDKKWVFSLFGPNDSIKNLSIGDKIAISNIVAIDINENRTLLKNYFIIKNITNSTVVVEFVWDFPLRRIERDSENHYIYVTKNIWLNGYFFNGRFSGIWNNGVLISYPFLTKMEKTHWIDGEFSGGHFKSRPIVKTFSFVNSKATSENKLQIKFDYPHKLNVGDKVYINENFNKASNMIGKTSVIEVIDNNIINFNVNYNTIFSKISSISYIIIYKSDSLIQNMNFYSLNMSKAISSESMDSRSLFSFNSWMDLVYDSTSATNILKPQSNFDDSLTRYSENNLYGWITKDILSSKSVFRDSFSNTLKTYKLGYKYEKLTDYIGNASYFNEYFLPNSTQFEDIGWKRTTFTQSSLTFSRTIDDGTDKLILGKELKIEAKDDGGLLNIIKPKVTIKNRKLSTIEDDRYTMVSFDLVNKKTTNDYYLKGNISDNYYYQPLIHFSNLNIVNKKGVLSSATYLPVYKNVDHTLSEDKRKTEFFYNKKDLMMAFRGSGINGTYSSTFVLDNLKFYETDMIPFFQYFNYSNINRSIQIPIHIKRYKSIKNEYSYEFIDFTYANDLNSIVYSDSDKSNYINLPKYKDLYQIPTYNNFTKGFDWNNTNFGNDSTQS
jgi:hypothetical protein